MSEAIAHILSAVQALGNNTTGVVLVTSTRSLEYWTDGGKKVVDQRDANPCKEMYALARGHKPEGHEFQFGC